MASESVAYERLDDDIVVETGLNATQDFDALYRRFYPRLVAMCRRRAGDDALAEDVAQETLIRALTHRDAFDHRRPAWPWFKTIATNLIIDHYRKQVRESALPPEHADAATEGPSIEEADLLRRAIEKLPRRQRAAVALRYLNDWDAHDAASFMGVTRPAYEQLLFRARRRLKLEYRRLSQELSAGVSAGTAALRAWSRRAGNKLREVGANTPLVDVTSITGAQLAGGAVAFAIVLGGQPIAAPAEDPHPAAAAQVTAAQDGASGGGRSVSRGPTTSDPAPPVQPDNAAIVAADEHDRTRNRNLLREMTNEDVHAPEDVHITSVALSPRPNGADYAAGRAECPSGLCPAVLFKSVDGGATWTRLAATGFDSEVVLVPRGGDDGTIFGMGRVGLQVSRDGGESFTAATTGAAHAAGTAAISPAFAEGDPSILIGAQTLMRYRDDLRVVEPTPWMTGTPPLNPYFAPEYPADQRVLVGGLVFNPEVARPTSAVHTCTGTICSHAFVGALTHTVHVRPAPDFARSNVAYAFTRQEIHVSDDGAATFRPLDLPWERGWIKDVAVGSSGRVYAAVQGDDGGLYVSSDGGRTWVPAVHDLFARGATSISIAADRIVVGLLERGFACSRDAGATWNARCSSGG